MPNLAQLMSMISLCCILTIASDSTVWSVVISRNNVFSRLITRHVVLPREMAKHIPRSHLMSEEEWRRLGVQQSQGWIHYMFHKPGTVVGFLLKKQKTLLKSSETTKFCQKSFTFLIFYMLKMQSGVHWKQCSYFFSLDAQIICE